MAERNGNRFIDGSVILISDPGGGRVESQSESEEYGKNKLNERTICCTEKYGKLQEMAGSLK